MVSEMEYQPIMPFIDLLILFRKHGITNNTLLAYPVTKASDCMSLNWNTIG